MTVTWIVVADRSRCKILELRSLKDGPRVIEEIENPDGRLQASEINSDRAGRSFDSKGAGRHGVNEAERVTDHVARKFAHRIGARLEDARNRQRFDSLALICGPNMLGLVREELSKDTSRLVIHSEAKAIAELPEHTLVTTVSNRVREALSMNV